MISVGHVKQRLGKAQEAASHYWAALEVNPTAAASYIDVVLPSFEQTIAAHVTCPAKKMGD